MTDLLVRGRPAVILLVEDSDDDVEITKIGFQRAKLAVDLRHVANGEDCLAFLRKEGQYATAPTPNIILLDLNMPRMSGIEVLQEINNDEKLRHLVVVVLTSSKADEDVLKSYKLRCNSYLVKPVAFDAFAKMIQSLGDYWFALVTLPPSE
ncbi:MAG TPA: response regulator [Kofleriaceae bacterium]|jgi:two-component system response regulator